ncbi:uncharacterized protein FOMMEDRAFT_159641 [Fomitiporia mediterranea MF3/22]|uniref:uncharacterized protein n=1 Tax=Fomitiporia mediterranea (strain MF3/22) TaxID=694068 RepID=UPI0004408681|nr:uncharacterized protein FOMMEDRAFT_159641 [Fomitiporia mediterranea MF3/22]EJD00048.1 hypothetical protein FOMMEDRAFT_159641 [Fomitiporia mediterranea MF3/22]
MPCPRLNPVPATEVNGSGTKSIRLFRVHARQLYSAPSIWPAQKTEDRCKLRADRPALVYVPRRIGRRKTTIEKKVARALTRRHAAESPLNDVFPELDNWRDALKRHSLSQMALRPQVLSNKMSVVIISPEERRIRALLSVDRTDVIHPAAFFHAHLNIWHKGRDGFPDFASGLADVEERRFVGLLDIRRIVETKERAHVARSIKSSISPIIHKGVAKEWNTCGLRAALDGQTIAKRVSSNFLNIEISAVFAFRLALLRPSISAAILSLTSQIWAVEWDFFRSSCVYPTSPSSSPAICYLREVTERVRSRLNVWNPGSKKRIVRTHAWENLSAAVISSVSSVSLESDQDLPDRQSRHRRVATSKIPAKHDFTDGNEMRSAVGPLRSLSCCDPGRSLSKNNCLSDNIFLTTTPASDMWRRRAISTCGPSGTGMRLSRNDIAYWSFTGLSLFQYANGTLSDVRPCRNFYESPINTSDKISTTSCTAPLHLISKQRGIIASRMIASRHSSPPQ